MEKTWVWCVGDGVCGGLGVVCVEAWVWCVEPWVWCVWSPGYGVCGALGVVVWCTHLGAVLAAEVGCYNVLSRSKYVNAAAKVGP